MLDITTAVFAIGLAFHPLLRPDPMLRRTEDLCEFSKRDCYNLPSVFIMHRGWEWQGTYSLFVTHFVEINVLKNEEFRTI